MSANANHNLLKLFHDLSTTCQTYLYLEVSARGNFAILRNFTFLSGWINLKVIFKIKKKKLQEKILYLPLVIARERLFCILMT